MLADKGAASMPTESIRMLRGVRQTREFQDRPVPDDALRDILEVARWSGSSRNSQPWELVVIADRDTLQRLAELIPFGKFLARAQLGIAVVMHGAGQGQSLDAGRIAERMMIAAHARGIGAGLATIPDAAFGLPAARDPAAPKRPGAGRRPLGEIVHHNRFGQRSH
jgi:nitroreductase